MSTAAPKTFNNIVFIYSFCIGVKVGMFFEKLCSEKTENGLLMN